MDRSRDTGHPDVLRAAQLLDYPGKWLRESVGCFRSDPARLTKHIGGACGTAAAGIYLTSPALTSPLLPLAITLFWASVALLERKHPGKVLVGLFAVIIASAWLSVPLAWVFKTDPAQTIWLAILTTAVLPLAWVRDPRSILWWLTPVWLVQAAVSLFQWITADLARVTGFAGNANAGAAFLLLGCVYLINGKGRARWLIMPLIAALPFSGSRWVAVVAAAVVLALFAGRWVSWRYILVGVIATVALVLITSWGSVAENFWRPSTLEVHIGGYAGQMDLPPSWIPRGFYDSGIHIVPWRMAHETGIASGLAWIGATVYGLWRRPRFDYRWWLLLTVGLLSGMYYFTWVGPLGWAWWLLVGSQRRDGPGHRTFKKMP